MPETITIETGQIFEVKKDMLGKPTCNRAGDRKVVIKKGEKIEIRYPYAWHYRTVDNFYFQTDEKELLKKCKLFGIIWGNVKFGNRAKLKDILEIRLYDKYDNHG